MDSTVKAVRSTAATTLASEGEQGRQCSLFEVVRKSPVPNVCAPATGPGRAEGPNGQGGGMPPQPSSTRGRAKSIRSEGTDRHLRRRRAAPQCFAQRGASELAGGGNNNTSSKDPGHPPC